MCSRAGGRWRHRLRLRGLPAPLPVPPLPPLLLLLLPVRLAPAVGGDRGPGRDGRRDLRRNVGGGRPGSQAGAMTKKE